MSLLTSPSKLPIPSPKTDINDGKAAGTGALVWTGIAGEWDAVVDCLVERHEKRLVVSEDFRHTVSPSTRLRGAQY